MNLNTRRNFTAVASIVAFAAIVGALALGIATFVAPAENGAHDGRSLLAIILLAVFVVICAYQARKD